MADMAANVLEFSDATFQSDVLDSKDPVLVDFWAPWCGPCKMLAPTIEQLAGDFSGKVRIGKLNTDENPKTPTSYGISGIPTVLIFKGGEVVEKFVGLTPKDKIATALKSHS
jgi:thioredoxin 1